MQHFGLRGRQEHHYLNFTLDRDDQGKKLITYAEGPTKTRLGGLRVKSRLIKLNRFVTGNERCPVALFKSYLKERPKGMNTSGPFYLAVIDDPVSQTEHGSRNPTWGKNSVLK